MAKKVHPIKPKEVAESKKHTIPNKVFNAFNKLIAKNWNGHSATFKQDDVVALIIGKELNSKAAMRKEEEIYENNLLDVEDVYRAAGWKVVYDKPAYNENYPATFTFSKK